MREPRWDDDRLSEAFRARFLVSAPDDVAPAILKALDAPRRRPLVLAPRRWIGAAAVVAALVLGSLQLLAGGERAPDTTPAPSHTALATDGPDVAFGLPVLSVEEAVRRRDTALDDTVLAVSGYVGPVGGPPVSCQPSAGLTSPVQPRCPDQFEWLMQDPEQLVTRSGDSWTGRQPSGPALNPIVRSPTAWALGREAGLDPLPPARVLVLGHFDDHRAMACPAAERGTCRRQFVVDRLVSSEGAAVTPEPVLDIEDRQVVTDEAVIRVLAESAGRGGRALAVGAIVGTRIGEVEPAAQTESLSRAHVVWIVKRLETWSGRPTTATILIPDGTGEAFLAGADGITALRPAISPEPIASPAFPAEILGLPVISVAEAIGRRETILDDTEIAVRGYFTAPNVGVELPCPATPADISAVQSRCPDPVTWMTDELERLWTRTDAGWESRPPSGPALNPLVRFDVPFEVPNLWNDTGPNPMPAVVLGHFGDRRAAACPEPSVEGCRRAFVVDALVWAAGRSTPLAPVVRTAEATESDDAVERRFRKVTGLVVEPIWLTVVKGSNVREIEPWAAEQAPELTRAGAVWLVRVLVRLDGDRPVVRTGYTIDGGGTLWIGVDAVVAPWGRRL
ncbi:MAG: hypothetical protein H0V87_08220 [Chloroflexi bacterium]|nr:hypothetical protein [Chloroflexota bacterium]